MRYLPKRVDRRRGLDRQIVIANPRRPATGTAPARPGNGPDASCSVLDNELRRYQKRLTACRRCVTSEIPPVQGLPPIHYRKAEPNILFQLVQMTVAVPVAAPGQSSAQPSPRVAWRRLANQSRASESRRAGLGHPVAHVSRYFVIPPLSGGREDSFPSVRLRQFNPLYRSDMRWSRRVYRDLVPGSWTGIRFQACSRSSRLRGSAMRQGVNQLPEPPDTNRERVLRSYHLPNSG